VNRSGRKKSRRYVKAWVVNESTSLDIVCSSNEKASFMCIAHDHNTNATVSFWGSSFHCNIEKYHAQCLPHVLMHGLCKSPYDELAIMVLT